MKVTYNSNNSGGRWWLKDEDWLALEASGWDVEWHAKKPEGSIMRGNSEGRWLGGLATGASKDFETLKEAISEFEEITGQDAMDEGCNCCGPPHRFEFNDESVSGEEIASHMFAKVPGSLREALELLNKDKK